MIRIIVGSRGSLIPNGPSSNRGGLRAGTALCQAAPSPKLCLSRLMSSPFCGFMQHAVVDEKVRGRGRPHHHHHEWWVVSGAGQWPEVMQW